MARIGHDSPAGRRFHGLEGDAPIFDSELVRVDQHQGGRMFIEVGRDDPMESKRVMVGHGELLRMAQAIINHFGGKA